MSGLPITFDDGAAYETFMGGWSRLAGEQFLDWLRPDAGLEWADIGCGNGAFTALICDGHAPRRVEGIDPSAGQIAHARRRLAGRPARFTQGDGMALPYDTAGFDLAVMALVIFFVPEPAQGVAEMVRVVRPGGLVTTYAWDIPGGGFPWDAGWAAMRDVGLSFNQPPQAAVSAMPALEALWQTAGLRDVETTVIEVHHAFRNFEAYWDSWRQGPGGAAAAQGRTPEQVGALRAATEARLGPPGPEGIVVHARANAVRGRVG